MIAALIDGAGAGAVMMLVPSNGVGSRYPLHEPDECGRAAGREHEMPVIRQHAERHQPDRMIGEPLFQNGEKGPIIRGPHEQRHPSGAAVDDVKVRGQQVGAARSRHDEASAC